MKKRLKSIFCDFLTDKGIEVFTECSGGGGAVGQSGGAVP